MIRLYGLRNCTTCKRAMTWLSERDIAFELVNYRDHPLPAQELLTYAKQLGGWEKLVNRASVTWRQLDDTQKSASTDEQWLALIAEYPTLIRRPLTLYQDGTVTVGFDATRWEQRLGSA